MITRVPPGTWETLSFPSSTAAGDTAYQLQIDPRLRVRGRGGRTTDATMVSPSEGNEARRNGRQGVPASHITPAAKKVIYQPKRAGSGAFPSLRVGLICSSMRNFLAGVIVPWKRGNQPEGSRQGKGVPSHEPLKRNLAGTS